MLSKESTAARRGIGLLPNFLCIGAQKAGTTGIAALLEQHPDVCMARPRETRFFVDDVQFGLGLQNYEISAFNRWNGEAAVGEKTPEYLLYDDTPRRVADALGTDVRLIVCLRNPAHRAFSQFRHNLMLRVETLPFDEALEAERSRTRGDRVRQALYGYRRRGLYAERLQPWLDLFGADRTLFVKFESDIIGEDAASLPDRLFQFLGVDRRPDLALAPEGRPTPAVWREDGDGLLIEGAKGSTRIRQPSPFLRQFAKRAAAAAPAGGRLTDEVALDLNRRFWAEDIQRTARMTGLDLDDWWA